MFTCQSEGAILYCDLHSQLMYPKTHTHTHKLCVHIHMCMHTHSKVASSHRLCQTTGQFTLSYTTHISGTVLR